MTRQAVRRCDPMARDGQERDARDDQVALNLASMHDSFIRCQYGPTNSTKSDVRAIAAVPISQQRSLSRCWNKIGSKAASICGSRDSNAARVGPSIWHCSGGSGTNIATEVAR